jgi:hypothetical protein
MGYGLSRPVAAMLCNPAWPDTGSVQAPRYIDDYDSIVASQKQVCL